MSRTRTKKTPKNGGESNVFSAEQEKVIKKMMKAAIKNALYVAPQVKYLTSGNSGALTVSPAFISLTDVPQGNTDVTRVGDELTPRDLWCKVEFSKNASSTLQADYCRVAVIQWFTQSGTAAPTGTTVYLNDPITASVTYRSQYIVDGDTSFKVLHDQTIILPGVPGDAGAAKLLQFRVPLERARRKIEYLAGSATNGWNLIYIVLFSNVSSTNIPNCAWTSKFTFTNPQ